MKTKPESDSAEAALKALDAEREAALEAAVLKAREVWETVREAAWEAEQEARKAIWKAREELEAALEARKAWKAREAAARAEVCEAAARIDARLNAAPKQPGKNDNGRRN